MLPSPQRVLEHTATSDRETLEKEIAFSRKTWQQEQEEYQLVFTESNELLSEERQRQEEDYQYETERSRKIATDEYEEIRQTERELQEELLAKEKQWSERERLLATKPVLEEYQKKVEVFSTELEEAVKKAREEGIREVNQEAKVKADLFEKEWKFSNQAYEIQIQALDV